MSFEIKAGQTTTVDLRGPQAAGLMKSLLAKRNPAGDAWTTFSVRHDGRPVSGVELTLWAIADDRQRLAVDLTDDAGHARCRLAAGGRYVAVARHRGRLIGWETFATPCDTVAIALRPCGTLVIEPPDPHPDPDAEPSHPTLRASLQNLPAGSPRNLLRLLCGEHCVVDDDTVLQELLPFYEESPAWLLEDLPAGAAWS